ncbi:MAG: class II aldolase/adducin family protein, partial [Bacilli bacterium]|nr:class II aldolase/adducin family protein [Bacilli bacterium]
MAYQVQEAKELVIKAGLKLVSSGLVARTWGNISARVSDTQFVVTPKGRAYDSLKPEDIVLVNIEDCSYEGDIKPSSEKGIHAVVYKLRKDVNFVIHTHQLMASVLSVLGREIAIDDNLSVLLGKIVPNAAYGISSTKKLAKNAALAIEKNPHSSAFLLKSHGAICLGATMEEAFDRSFALEKIAEKEILRLTNASSIEELEKRYTERFAITNGGGTLNLGKSIKKGTTFTLTISGEEKEYSLIDKNEALSDTARIHHQLYLSNGVNCIVHNQDHEVVVVSRSGKTLHPYIDDVAQIIGVNIHNVEPHQLNRKIKGRNAVMIHGQGALCIGLDEDDVEAVGMILRKECLSEMLVAMTKGGKPLGKF